MAHKIAETAAERGEAAWGFILRGAKYPTAIAASSGVSFNTARTMLRAAETIRDERQALPVHWYEARRVAAAFKPVSRSVRGRQRAAAERDRAAAEAASGDTFGEGGA